MRIKKLETKDFQGLGGNKSYQLPKIVALSDVNGAGKTSFLNAVRFGLTGSVDNGDIIHYGAGSAAVGITIDDTEYMRQTSYAGAGKMKNKWYLRTADKRGSVTEKEFSETMKNNFGLTGKDMRFATSSSLLRSMKPAELNEYLLKFIPQTFTTGQLESWIPNCTPQMKTIMQETLPATAFGSDAIRHFYSAIYDRRKMEKKALADLENRFKRLEGVQTPARPRDEVMADYNAALAQQRAEGEYAGQLQAYNTAVRTMEENKKNAGMIRQQIESIHVRPHDPGTRDALNQRRMQAENAKAQANAAIGSNQAVLASAQRMLSSLSCNTCPISERLICQTDKSAVKGEVEENIRNLTAAIDAQKKVIASAEQALRDIDEQLRIYNEEERMLAQRGILIARYNEIVAQIKNGVMTPPTPPAASGIPAAQRIQQDVNDLRMYDACVEKTAVEKELAEKRELVAALESLVFLFKENGDIRNRIAGTFVSAFTDICNRCAKEINPNMTVRFDTSRGGLTPLFDISGSGTFIPLGSLSGGEQVYALFVLLQMLGEVSGTRMIILDELSVLDTENFKKMIQLLVTHDNLYDQAFIAAAKHADIDTVLGNSGITLTAV